MRIELPSGAWVEVKDTTSPGDRFAVQDAAEIVIEDGRTVLRGAASGRWKAFLTRVITGWSFPVPVPASGGDQVLDSYPESEDDDDALFTALEARYDRIINRGRPTTRTQPGAAPSSS